MPDHQRVQLNGAGHFEPYDGGSYVVVPHEEWYIRIGRSNTEREVILDATNNRLLIGIGIMEEALRMVDDLQCNFPEWWYEGEHHLVISCALDWKNNG